VRALQRLTNIAERRRRRPELPLAPDVGVLAEEAKAAARLVWARRYVNEAASVRLGERLRRNLRGAGLPAEVERAADAALARLVEDEQRHVELATEVLVALGASLPAGEGVALRALGESPVERLLHDVTVGLLLCESVSASRFASVWAATDLPAFRERIGVFLRDEIAHARLGVVLLPPALEAYAARAGEEAARGFVVGSLESAIAELVVVVAGGARPGDLPPPRPQPTQNPGVVEPAVDARALYRALTRLGPLVESLSTPT